MLVDKCMCLNEVDALSPMIGVKIIFPVMIRFLIYVVNSSISDMNKQDFLQIRT